MTHTFRNAYHFIPRTKVGPRSGLVENHDVYQAETFSGEIQCTLKLEQPTVFGAKRTKQAASYAVLEQFMYQGKPAIPASSIKGLVGGLIEAATLSAYRVLGNEKLTVLLPRATRRMPETQYLEFRKKDIGTVHDYLNSNELRPLGDGGRKDDAQYSLAEQMLGFVSKTNGFAGRLRPTLGTLAADWVNLHLTDLFETGDHPLNGVDWVRLKALAQPMKDWVDKGGEKHRNATPNFYMRMRDKDPQNYISKEIFASGGSECFEIQGSKGYLHHLNSDQADPQPWASKATVEQDTRTGLGRKATAEGKTLVRPLKRGVTFDFSIAFDNLTADMLNALCFALYPSERFRHKIGYGKPLGLGSVHIVPTGLHLVDRTKRYHADRLLAARFGDCIPLDKITSDYIAKHTEWLKGVAPDTLNAILLIGETHNFAGAKTENDAVPVLWVPLTNEKFKALSQTDSWKKATAEDWSSNWFSYAEKNPNEDYRLKPILATSKMIPTLKTNPGPPPRQSAQGGGGGDAGGGRRNNEARPQPEGRPHTSLHPAPAAPQANRQSGKIKVIRPDRRYGFIIPDVAGPDVYFRARNVSGTSFAELRLGDPVTFEYGPSDHRGCPAVNVQRS